MDVSGSYIDPMAVIGMKVSKQVQVGQAQVVASALAGAKQTADNPPPAASSGRLGGVDIRV